MKELLKNSPITVFMLALSGWTEEQINTQPDHLIEAGLLSVKMSGESMCEKATANDLVKAAEVAKAVCGDSIPVTVKTEPKKSRFHQRLEEMQKERREDKERNAGIV